MFVRHCVLSFAWLTFSLLPYVSFPLSAVWYAFAASQVFPSLFVSLASLKRCCASVCCSFALFPRRVSTSSGGSHFWGRVHAYFLSLLSALFCIPVLARNFLLVLHYTFFCPPHSPSSFLLLLTMFDFISFRRCCF